MSSPWITQVDPNSDTSVLIRDRRGEDKTHRQDHVRVLRETEEEPKEPWGHRHWRRQEGFSPELLGERGPADAFISDSGLQNWGRRNSCCFW